nr:hypothetical protein HAGR004_37780 [Bdellovibrio sp. HAGR004]
MLRIPSTKIEGFFDFGGLGTGFFISKFGIFLTAKHVLEKHMQYQNGKGLEAWVVIDGQNFTCPIRDIQLHPTADLAVGYIAPPYKDGKPAKEFAISLCKISSDKIKANDAVYSYGYPRTILKHDENDADTVVIDMKPDYYTGNILEYHPTGVSICRWPIYRHSMPTASGMSGGPLLHKTSNTVVGINCTGDSTNDADIEHGSATDVTLCLDLLIEAEIPNYKGKSLEALLKYENNLFSIT